MMLKINDVTTELLSVGKGSGTIVDIIAERDKNQSIYTDPETNSLYCNTIESKIVCLFGLECGLLYVLIKKLTNDSGLGSNIHVVFSGLLVLLHLTLFT